MTDTKEKKSELPLANIGYLLLMVVVGGLFVGQDPFHESRPDKQMDLAWEYSGLQDVEARLWQDPLEAVSHSQSSQQILLAGDQIFIAPQKSNLPAINGHITDDSISIEDWLSQLGKHLGSGETVVFMAVMLPGGPYVEDGETRRRLRYAVLSGFNAALDFVPEDAEHIGVFRAGTASKVVFEAVARPKSVLGKNSPPAYILYLNSSDYTEHPYENLTKVFKPILSLCTNNHINCHVNLLGPSDSELLRNLAMEIHENRFHPDPMPKNFRVYSPRATLDENRLLVGKDGEISLPEYLDYEASRNKELLTRFFREIGLNFTRTTATDTELAKAMATELIARGVISGNQASSGDKHVVLLSEKETLYGWHIGDTFAEYIVGCYRDDVIDAKSKQACEDNKSEIIDQFSYFRGLDGEHPRKTGNAASNPNRLDEAQHGVSKDTQEEMERADGDSQFDYVRRLVNKLELLERQLNSKSSSIGAIGILGSDVYDKLLVLEAVHDRFPHVLFFTTGMDARFLHPDQNKFARNLIVVSSFGLELAKQWQRDIPPFRDSTQTGYFLSTEMALWDSFYSPDQQAACSPNSKPGEIIDNPRIHEIGRTKAFDLPPAAKIAANIPEAGKNRSKAQVNNECAPMRIPTPYTSEIHPQYTTNLPIKKQLPAILAMSAFFVWAVWGFFNQWLAKTGNGTVKYQIARRQQLSTTGLLLAGLTAIAYGASGLLGANPAIPVEPWSFSEGVSMWPSEIVRFLAIIVAFNGLVDAYHWPTTIRAHLRHKFGFSKQFAASEFNFACKPLILGLGRNRLAPQGKFLISRKLIFAGKFLLICLFSVFLIRGFGILNIPFRGETISQINAFLMFLLLIIFICSYILIMGRTQEVIRYIEEKNSDFVTIIWPFQSRSLFASQVNMPDIQLHEWVTIRLISELTVEANRLLLYPMLVLALHVLSRLSYFDNWITPPGLLLALLLGFVYIFYCDFRLKTMAEEVEKNAMSGLRKRLVRSYANTGSTVAAQLAQLVDRSESYAQNAYKPFLHRPVFQGLILVIAAAALDYSDYGSLVMKLFK